MPDEEKEQIEEQVVREQSPQDMREFVHKHFSKFFFAVILLLFLRFVEFEGKATIDDHQFISGFAILVVCFALLPSMFFFRKRPPKVSEIEPLNPLEEKSHFEEKFRKAGMDINVLEALPEPYEGSGSDQPFTTHFLGERQFADGSRKPFIFRAGNLTRIPISWIHRSYLENRSYSSAGTRKRPTEVIEIPRPIQTTPQKVQVIVPRVGGKEEKEEEEEEEEK